MPGNLSAIVLTGRRTGTESPPPSVRTVKKIGSLLFGWGFIFGGIVGLILPVLPGVLFMIVGLLILSSEYVWANQLLQMVRARYPRLSSRLNEAATKAYNWTGKR